MDPFAKRLNSLEYLPDKAYRRNTKIYELVSYVNCLMGCRASGNTQAMQLFKGRAQDFIINNPPEPEFERYFELVGEYIKSLEV